MKKLLIVCLGDPFTENMLYKENYLIEYASEIEYQIFVYASLLYHDGNHISKKKPGYYSLGNNTILYRTEFDKVIFPFLKEKIRKSSYLENIYKDFQPDVVFFNTPQTTMLNLTRKMKKINPNTKIVAEFTTTELNSARNMFSKNILHKFLYRRILSRSLSNIDEIYSVSNETNTFLKKYYGISEEKIIKINLPSKVYTLDDKKKYKSCVQMRHNISKDSIIWMHSGKLTGNKRTIELIDIFNEIDNMNIYLFIIGSIDQNIESQFYSKISDNHQIIHIDFMSSKDLLEYLLAADIYIQPGTYSQTAQQAIGCGCIAIYSYYEIYEVLVNGNGELFTDLGDLLNILLKYEKLSNLADMQLQSFKLAHKYLDYRSIGAKILGE